MCVYIFLIKPRNKHVKFSAYKGVYQKRVYIEDINIAPQKNEDEINQITFQGTHTHVLNAKR